MGKRSERRALLWLAAVGLWLTLGAACGGGGTSDLANSLDDARPDVDPFHLKSSAFDEGERIPKKYGCADLGGKNISPPLQWKYWPSNTQSFALVVTDPDAPDPATVHWGVINMRLGAYRLGEDTTDAELPSGAWELLTYLDVTGYQGPCPPSGQQHHYVFTLYALDKKIPKPTQPATLPDIQDQLETATIKSTQLTGLYP
jgi:Raf kinase inhibitor-like YbhB/YbcL family protein